MTHSALVVGLGQIGMGYDVGLAPETFVYSHARALSLHPGFNLIGAVDPCPDKRAKFQAKHRAFAYETVEEAIEALTVDLVIVATPTQTHYDLLRKLLDFKGLKLILCEKPLSYSLDESRKMLSMCEEKNISLYVNYMRHSEPGVVEVKRRIESGEISWPLKGVAWYSKGFLHNGSHFFNLLEHWLGQAKAFNLIEAGRALAHGDAEPDVRVVFEKGEVVLLASKDENFSHNEIELIAANGRLRYANGGRGIEWNSVCVDENLRGYSSLATISEQIPAKFNCYQWHVVEQLDCALKGRQARLCTGRQALNTLEQMYSILESRR